MDKIIVDSVEAELIAVRDAVQKLYDAGYNAVDVRTSVDEDGYEVITVTPIDHNKELDEIADKVGFLQCQ